MSNAGSKAAHGCTFLIKPMLGLYNGRPGARLFRRHLSENAPRDGAGIAVLREALSFVRQREAA